MRGPKDTKREWTLKWVFLVVLFPVLFPLVLLALILYWGHRLLLYSLVWIIWLPQGKDVMIVYSESPIWNEYMTTQVIPLIGKRSVDLNWSERKKWPKWSLQTHVFYSFGGHTEFNPMVIIFRPFRLALVFRFWSAFKDWKLGYTRPVETLRGEILRSLQ